MTRTPGRDVLFGEAGMRAVVGAMRSIPPGDGLVIAIGSTDSARTRQLIVFAVADHLIAALEPREAHLLADAMEAVADKAATPLEGHMRATVAMCRQLANLLERPSHAVH